jgi:sugar lactone lactonase YvrE
MNRRLLNLLILAGAAALAWTCGGGEPAPADAPADTAAAVDTVQETAPPPPAPIVVEGFDQPESVLHDAAADLYLVSNINGHPTEKDNNGYISRLAPDGTVAQRNWIAGGKGGVTLHAPKGSAIIGETLFVADIDTVRLFDRRTGEPAGAWPVEGATFLNDLATASDGTLYVSDTGIRITEEGIEPTETAAIHRFDEAGTATRVEIAGDVSGVNGIALDDRGIHAVAFGPGTIFTVAPSGERTDHSYLPGRSLDGLVLLEDGSTLISDWATETVYRVGPEGSVEQVGSTVTSPADIGFDATRSRVLIPVFMENRVVLQPLN